MLKNILSKKKKDANIKHYLHCSQAAHVCALKYLCVKLFKFGVKVLTSSLPAEVCIEILPSDKKTPLDPTQSLQVGAGGGFVGQRAIFMQSNRSSARQTERWEVQSV